MTPRLNLLMHLGLAVSHSTGTTPDALEAAETRSASPPDAPTRNRAVLPWTA